MAAWWCCAVLSVALALCCGADEVVRLKGRIHNGRPATVEKYPFIVFVRTLHQSSKSKEAVIVTGTGVIISEQWVVTAGHILDSDRYTNDERVLITALFVAGISNLREHTGIYNCANVFVHPLFNSSLYYQYDIGLMSPVKRITLSSKAQPIPLGYLSDIVPNTIVDVCGWGNSDEDGIKFDVGGGAILLEAHMAVLAQKLCHEINQGGGYQTPGTINICIMGFGPYAHRGDSGGPVVYNGRLVGIVASGQKGYPTFATSIPQMRTYIAMVTGIM